VVAERLSGLPVPWCIAGGWALDLFLGEQTRPHADLEIAIPADGFAEVVARFGDCAFYAAEGGQVLPASPVTLRASHQTWAWDPTAGRWRFDVMREPHDAGNWIYRRDHRIRYPYAEIIGFDPGGIPYLAPEIVLLFKAKGTRIKDQADFDRVLPLLDAERRQRLHDALARVDPTHPWHKAVAGTL
jgi:hypothetical protein